MRVSVRDNDPGYDEAAQAGWWGKYSGKCKILVDGLDVTDICSTADEEQGVVFCYKLNKDGRKYIELDPFPNAEFIASQALYGKVEIQIPGRNGEPK